MTPERRTAAVPPESEKQFMQAVIDLARMYRWACFHQYDSRRSEAGWPDLFLLRPPRAVAIECKSARGKVSPAQAVCLALLRACGIEVYTLRPRDKQSISEILR